MKKRFKTELATLLALGLMLSLCSCGGNSGADRRVSNSSGSNSVGTASGSASQNADSNSQSPNIRYEEPPSAPTLSVVATGSRTADITLMSNGVEYPAYSISLHDPTLENADQGNHYTLSLDYYEGEGYRCEIYEAMHNWGSDDRTPDAVAYESLGGGDYVFHVKLPKVNTISFDTIDEYNIWVSDEKGSHSFRPSGFAIAAADVTVKNYDGSQDDGADEVDKKRVVEILTNYYLGRYRNTDASLGVLEEGNGSIILWPTAPGFGGKVEISEFHDTEYYDVVIDMKDERLTFDIKEKTEVSPRWIKLTLDYGNFTLETDSGTFTISKSTDRIR